MTKECFKNDNLLKKLEQQKVPPDKEKAKNYVKRSLQLGQEGYQQAVIMDKAGDVAAAAAFELLKGGIHVETLGSIGVREGIARQGHHLMYDIMKAADKTKTGRITLFAESEAINYYDYFNFKESPENGRIFYLDRSTYKHYISYHEREVLGIIK